MITQKPQNHARYISNLTEGTRIVNELNTFADNLAPLICIVGCGRFIGRTSKIICRLKGKYRFALLDHREADSESKRLPDIPAIIWGVYPNLIGEYAHALSEVFDAPLVMSMRGEFWDICACRSTRRELARTLNAYEHAKFIAPVCDRIKYNFFARFPEKLALANKFVTIPNGSYIEEANKQRMPMQLNTDAKPIIGALTSFPFPEKYQATLDLINAVNKCEKFNGVLLVGGIISQHKNMTQGKIGNNVIYLGEIQNIWPWYKALSVYIHASYREGQASAVMEAMSYGLPVVLVDHPNNGTAEFIDHGRTGFIVKSVDEAVRFVNDVLLPDSALRAEIGANAKQEMATKYTWEKTAKAYGTLFQAVLK